ncbi:MAG: hypothetical protein HXS53_05820 [Theionarchaea archaeon]|nr:hypothetical protein [Theionarchaea archaeon]
MMKKEMALISVVCMLCTMMPAALASHNSFSVEYEFNFSMKNGGWIIDDTIIQEIPGEPLIPYRHAKILLPQDAIVKDVKFHYSAPIEESGIDIFWGQPPCTFSDNPVKIGRNEEIYSSNSWYPHTNLKVVSVESFRGFNILNVMLYPLQYKPLSRTVRYYQNITVDIQVEKGSKNAMYRALPGDKNAVGKMVDNSPMIDTYSDVSDTTVSPLLESGTYEYIIITNSTLTPTFQALADWKGNFLNGTKIVDIQWIYDTYSGYDNAEKMRNFIIDAYNTWNTTWCLLGGDIAVVPYRGFYVKIPGGRDPDMAADMYFGCLDGNFDADGDHTYGESTDNVDWLMEVFIGRAPVETISEAETFVNKVIAYEQADKLKICQFHESRVVSGNDPDARVVAWDCEYWTPSDYEKRELFEENGHISKTDWINAWNGKPILFQHIGHGNTTVYDINYEVDGNTAWYNADMPSLINSDFWPVHMSVACITGQFTSNDCLAEEYVKSNCGAIGAMMNDNYGWFSSLDASKYSGDFIETMFRAVFSDGREHLGELLNQAKSYWVAEAESNGTYRWCYYEINLMGDPETPCLTKRQGGVQPDSITITNPVNGSTIQGTVTVSTSTTGAIDEVRFYIDDVLTYTDTTAPYTYDWDTTQYTDSSHTIKAEGYVAGVLKDTDTVTVTVDNIVDYYITIMTPANGSTVSGTVAVTADTNCDEVRFYIDDVLTYTDTTSPYTYDWDTTQYTDSSHTIKAEGYVAGVLKDTDTVTVTVNNAVTPYVEITYPTFNQTVSGTVLITTETAGVDTVEFLVDNALIFTDTTAPFECSWDTTGYVNGNHWLKAQGYASGVLKDTHTIKVRISNTTSLGIGLLSMLALLIHMRIRRK